MLMKNYKKTSSSFKNESTNVSIVKLPPSFRRMGSGDKMRETSKTVHFWLQSYYKKLEGHTVNSPSPHQDTGLKADFAIYH